MAQRRPVESLASAGGVVYRSNEDTLELLLCGRKRERPLWSLPKGTPESGETLEQTALREVREETGLDVELVTPIGSINYWFVRSPDGARCHKTVHFYLMRPVGGSLDRHDPEFDEVRWFPMSEGLRVMTYLNEARMVEQALAQLEARG